MIGTYAHAFISCVIRPRLTVATCVGPTMRCISPSGGNPTWFKMHSVHYWCPLPDFSTPEYVHVHTTPEPTLAHQLPTFWPLIIQPSNRAPPCLVQGTMIHLCGLLLKWVPVTRVSYWLSLWAYLYNITHLHVMYLTLPPIQACLFNG